MSMLVICAEAEVKIFIDKCILSVIWNYNHFYKIRVSQINVEKVNFVYECIIFILLKKYWLCLKKL